MLEKPKLRNKNLLVVVDGQLVPETKVAIPQKVMRKGARSTIPNVVHEPAHYLPTTTEAIKKHQQQYMANYQPKFKQLKVVDS